MRLVPEPFFEHLDGLFPAADFLIAFSGGLDSTVLLDLCVHGAGAENRHRIAAIHVDHCLHPQSGQWAAHCAETCKNLKIAYRVLTLDSVAQTGRSLEEAARSARYETLRKEVRQATVLLTAQHQDDQAETILLQLLRGCGLKGLCGMPKTAAFGLGILHRPFLDVPRQSLRAHAESRGLSWIEDPSNADTRHRRNFLRHEIIPRLRENWPGLDKALSRSARHCAEAQAIIDREVETWFRDLIETDPSTISITKLKAFDASRARLLIRHWIRRCGFPIPNAIKLEKILSDVIGACADRMPIVQWACVEIRRYRDKLYLRKTEAEFDHGREVTWSIETPLRFPEIGGVLECDWTEHAQQGQELPSIQVVVRFRAGAGTCRIPGGACSRSLKKIFQEHSVPPWERDRIPLIYLEDKLVAIAGLDVGEPFRTIGLQFRWSRLLPWERTFLGCKDSSIQFSTFRKHLL